MRESRESGHRNESLCPRNARRGGRHIGFLFTHFRPRDQVAKNLYSPQLRPYNDIAWGQAQQWEKGKKRGRIGRNISLLHVIFILV